MEEICNTCGGTPGKYHTCKNHHTRETLDLAWEGDALHRYMVIRCFRAHGKTSAVSHSELAVVLSDKCQAAYICAIAPHLSDRSKRFLSTLFEAVFVLSEQFRQDYLEWLDSQLRRGAGVQAEFNFSGRTESTQNYKQ